MKLFIKILLLFLFPTKCLFCFSLPEEFFIKQHWFSTTVTFDILTKDKRMGIVDRKFWSLRCEYDFYDDKGICQAKALGRILSLGAIFDVTDSSDHYLGRVDEHFISLFPTFDLISPEGEVQAIAKMNFWGTEYTLSDPLTKKEIATLSRKFLRIKDDWTVKIIDPELFSAKKIDPRLFITVMAFQTDSDSWKK